MVPLGCSFKRLMLAVVLVVGLVFGGDVVVPADYDGEVPFSYYDDEPLDLSGYDLELLYEADLRERQNIVLEKSLFEDGSKDGGRVKWPAKECDWVLEGEGHVKRGEEGLEFHTYPEGAEWGEKTERHMVLWNTRKFPADFLLEFDMQPIDPNEGLAIVFICAMGRDGESIFSLNKKYRGGNFRDYHSGDLDSYHISYWAGRGYANLRKNYGHDRKISGMDNIPRTGPRRATRIRVLKVGGEIKLESDGKTALVWTDPEETIHGAGYIGLRNMGHSHIVTYGQFKVWGVHPPRAETRRGRTRDDQSERRDGQARPEREGARATLSIKPTFENISYGPDERNVLDFWQAKSKKPAPVVVYIHGGGFINGSKDKVREKEPADIERCLANGVSFASISYRLRDTTRLDEIMLDCARAIQFLRYRSEEWNIDKSRFAAYGSSAGGGASLWLAVHGDVADIKSKDPVLRESSRLAVAGHQNSQATYDCEKWADIVGVASSWQKDMNFDHDLIFYGTDDRDMVDSPKVKKVRQKVDMLSFMDAGDPPLFLHNPKFDIKPTSSGDVIHHQRHAKYLKKKCDELGIEAVLVVGETDAEEQVDIIDFLFKHLAVKSK